MAYGLVLRADVMSDLLTIREKGSLLNLVGPQCKLIKTTVAQVLEAKGGRSGWSCLGSGVLCLVEDESPRSHFLRLYCVKGAKLLWEQELYIPFQYTAACKYFHTFPADGYFVGFNFADETEAEEFHLEVKAVQRKQETMTNVIKMTSAQRDEGMKPLDYVGTRHLPVGPPSTDTVRKPPGSDLDPFMTGLLMQASPPEDNLKFKDLDPVMGGLLMQASLSEEDLKDKEIAEAVDWIISKFGGLHAVQRALSGGDSGNTSQSAAGPSISPSLEKGYMPPGPPINSSIKAPKHTEVAGTRYQSPPTPAPFPGRPSQNEDCYQVGPSVSAVRNDLLLSALKEVFRQRQLQ